MVRFGVTAEPSGAIWFLSLLTTDYGLLHRHITYEDVKSRCLAVAALRRVYRNQERRELLVDWRNAMSVELLEKPAEECGAILVELPGYGVPCTEEDHVVIAGTGRCRACRDEKRSNPCYGYINTGHSPYACKTCGHSYDRHE